MWKTLDQETLIDTRYVKVKKNHVQLPGGGEIPDFYTVTIPDAAGVVAVTDDGQVLLKSEFRYSQGEELVEVPAGVFDPHESDPLVVARRELLEETGYSSDQWTYLGATVESSSKLTGKMHLFLARNCVKTAQQHLDENEVLNMFAVPMEKAVAMVMDGQIRCNSSAHAILMAARILGV